MPILSTRFSALLFILAGGLAWNQSHIWTKLSPVEQLRTLGLLLFSFLMTASGWVYVAKKKKSAGLLHAALTLAAAFYCLQSGFAVLGDRSVMGGRGPDANPMAGVVYGFGLLSFCIGFFSLICGAGALVCILKTRPKNA